MNANELMSADAVRERCSLILAAADRDLTLHFRLVSERLDEAVRRVVEVTRRRYPDLRVPYHSRWRHFNVNKTDRASLIAPGADRQERTRAMFDLVIVSVLLDAGAGPTWQFCERETWQVLSRSEGLAVASLRAMQAGLFSADPGNPWRADAAALLQLAPRRLSNAFQCTRDNGLLGLDGRVELLRSLGEVAAASPEFFDTPPRLGNLFDHFQLKGESIEAADILSTLLRAINAIWPSRIAIDGVSLGDCGRHSFIWGDGLVPFHKLSQWLAYSLFEPLEEAGILVTNPDRLTALAEYRNGGLFLDTGVLQPRNPELPRRLLAPTSEEVVEWRALTVALIDRIVPLVRQSLGVAAEQFPLARVLEGGTWAAGRELAAELRDGRPPLMIENDGTWF